MYNKSVCLLAVFLGFLFGGSITFGQFQVCTSTCNDGYVLEKNIAGVDVCVQTVTTGAIYQGGGPLISAGDLNTNYGAVGIRRYTSSGMQEILDSTSFFAGGYTTLYGRFLNLGIKVNGYLNQWRGVSYCLPVAQDAEYIIAGNADNHFRAKVNGNIVIQGTGNTTVDFRPWYTRPVHLSSGNHVIEILNYNLGGPDAMGAEIVGPFPAGTFFDEDGNMLTGQDFVDVLYSEGTTGYVLPRSGLTVTGPVAWIDRVLWTTRDEIGSTNAFDIGETFGYSCPVGYAVNTENNVCGQIGCYQKITQTPIVSCIDLESDVYVGISLQTSGLILSGDEIGYLITYGNNGPDETDIVITSTYPEGFTPAVGGPITLTNVPNGGSGTILVTGFVIGLSGTQLIYDVSVTSTLPDPVLVNNNASSASVITRIEESDVYIGISLQTSGLILSGDEIGYLITYGNNGPDETDIVITSTYPEGFTPAVGGPITLTDVPNGGSGTILVTGFVIGGSGTQLIYDVSVTSTLPDPVLVNNNASNTYSITRDVMADVSVIIYANKNEVRSGSVVTYTLTYMNGGPDTTNIDLMLNRGSRFTSFAPSSYSFFHIPTGSGGTIQFTGVVYGDVGALQMMHVIATSSILESNVLNNESESLIVILPEPRHGTSSSIIKTVIPTNTPPTFQVESSSIVNTSSIDEGTDEETVDHNAPLVEDEQIEENIKEQMIEEITVINEQQKNNTEGTGNHYFLGTPNYLSTGIPLDEALKIHDIKIVQSPFVNTTYPNRGKPFVGLNYPRDLNYWLDNVLLPHDEAAKDAPLYVLIPSLGYIVPIMLPEGVNQEAMIHGESIDLIKNKELQSLFAQGGVHHAGSVTPGLHGRSAIALHSSWFHNIPGKYIGGKYDTIGQLLISLTQDDEVVFYVKNKQNEYSQFVYSVEGTQKVSLLDTNHLYPGQGYEALLYTCADFGTDDDSRFLVHLRMNKEKSDEPFDNFLLPYVPEEIKSKIDTYFEKNIIEKNSEQSLKNLIQIWNKVKLFEGKEIEEKSYLTKNMMEYIKHKFVLYSKNL